MTDVNPKTKYPMPHILLACVGACIGVMRAKWPWYVQPEEVMQILGFVSSLQGFLDTNIISIGNSKGSH